MDADDDIEENAQIYPKDMHIFKSCPVWEELIFVQCRYCNCSILAHSIKNHVEMRHTGNEQYEKDPDLSIFRKVVKKPTVLSSTLTPRASPAAYGIHSSRTPTSCSAEAFSEANLSPRVAEQFLGWPNSPHGATQQSPLNMTTNHARVKPENKVVIPPRYSGKMASILAKNPKSALELSAAIPMMKPEPYNQSFSFSSTPDIMPPTSARDMPSTSYEMPSTSYEMPSTSYEMPSTSKGLLPCQPYSPSETGYGGCMMYGDIPQSLSSTYAAGSLENPQPKTPKIVLRRVLQTDSKSPAEGSQSDQDLKDMTQKRKAPQNTYFMVVNKNKDHKKKLVSVKNNIRRKKAKDRAIALRLKRLKKERNKLIAQLFHELECVTNKLDQCNRSKKQIEKELRVVKADLEETKRKTDFRNEDLMKKNAEFENEIQKLKQRNEMLTTTCNDLYAEHATIYTQRLENPWNYAAGNQMSKHLHNIEDQKLELQRCIEELESESRELKHSLEIERRKYDAKLNHFFKVITELKKRYEEQQNKSTELKLQREFFEKYLKPKVIQWKCLVASSISHNQPEVHEVYPGLLTPQPTPPISSPTIPLAETMQIDTQNVNYMSFQSQSSPARTEVFQQQQQSYEQPQPQQEVIQDEEVS